MEIRDARTSAADGSLVVRDEATIGRSNDNDIVLNDFSVSRRHAILRKDNGGWVIHDNQSTNGVRIKEKLVQSPRVGDGDQAVVGTFVLRFREEIEAPPAAATARANVSWARSSARSRSRPSICGAS